MAESLQRLDIQVAPFSSEIYRIRLLFTGTRLVIEPPRILRGFRRCGIDMLATSAELVTGILEAFEDSHVTPLLTGQTANFDLLFDPMGFVNSFRALRNSQADRGWRCVMGAAIYSPDYDPQFLHNYAMPMDFLLQSRHRSVNIEHEAQLIQYVLEFQNRRVNTWQRIRRALR